MPALMQGSLTQKWQTEVETYVRQNPIKAVFVALALGLVLSRMFRKSECAG
jgi:ElaB/YqjD/DUF883 family membrane-anchored ribosome-binding protein